jgi:hypothetical protein
MSGTSWYDFVDDDLKILVLEAMPENIVIVLLSLNVSSGNPKLSVHIRCGSLLWISLIMPSLRPYCLIFTLSFRTEIMMATMILPMRVLLLLHEWLRLFL